MGSHGEAPRGRAAGRAAEGSHGTSHEPSHGCPPVTWLARRPRAPPQPGSDGADLPREVHPSLDVRDVHMGRILSSCQEKAPQCRKALRRREIRKVAQNRVVGVKSEKSGKSENIVEIDVLGRFQQPAAYTSEKCHQMATKCSN